MASQQHAKEISPERIFIGLWVLVAASLFALQVIVLLAMQIPLICPCGRIELWYANPSGPETSLHITDWYTYTHIIHGFGFYLLLWMVAPRTSFMLRLTIAIGLEVGWEIIENMPFIVDRYRQTAIARDYFGDSVINSLCDTFAAAFGFAIARVLPIWVIVALTVGAEGFAAYMIRDNLVLNVVQLVYPSEQLSRWQVHE